MAGTDLGIKAYVEKHVKQREERSIWNRRGILRKVHNHGMMMNRLEQHPLAVKLGSVCAMGALFIWQALVLCRTGHQAEKLGTALMAGGAVSNTFDRLKRGYVVDYLAFRTRHKKLTEVTFNLGDFAIFGGALLTVAGALMAKKS